MLVTESVDVRLHARQGVFGLSSQVGLPAYKCIFVNNMSPNRTLWSLEKCLDWTKNEELPGVAVAAYRLRTLVRCFSHSKSSLGEAGKEVMRAPRTG